MTRFVRLFCILVAGLTVNSFARAQNLGTGLYTFGSFDSRGFDSINLGNLNTHFEIPIVSKKGRGQDFNYSIVYDGLMWAPTLVNGVEQWMPDNTWGFHGQLGGGVTGFLTYFENDHALCSVIDGSRQIGSQYTNYVYHDQFGRQHAFKYSYTFCPQSGNQYFGDGTSSDGSGYYLSGQQVHSRSGAVIHVPSNPTSLPSHSGSIVDSNGNTITENGDGTFTDTLGVTALTITGSGTASSPLSLSYPVTLQADNSLTATATLSYRTYSVQTNFQCPGIAEQGAIIVDLPDHLTLADGATIYSFAYEATPGVSGAVTGRLASVTLPTGGTISYAYSDGCNGSGINADGTPATLTRTTTDGPKTYARVINGTTSATNTTDEKNNAAIYTFTSTTNSLWYETERKIYQGGVSGIPLQDKITQYNGQTTPTQLTAAPTQIDILEQFNGGSQSHVSNTYDASGMLTSTAQLQGSSTLETTTNVYNSFEEVTSSTTKDGSGNQIAYSSYGYDGSGNQTSTSTWTGISNLTTTTNYNSTGGPINTTTSNGTTTFGYDPTQTFVTSTTLPTPSSGVQLTTSASYDPNSGVQISATGMNPGQITQYTQYDRLLRPTIVSLPNASQINYNYYNPTQVAIVQSMGNGQSTNTSIEYDAYGRKSRIAVFNGQATNGWYQVDYCYDTTGLLQFQSIRYQGPGFVGSKQCSGNGTSYAYDALGRVTSSTDSDGTTSNQYLGRAIEKTDVNGVQRITQYDLLGRVSSICEISPNTLPGSGTPGPCGTDLGGTGYATSYSYNLVSHATTIAQGAQTRSFATDAAGRTTSVTEPERGQTTYSYAYNGTGLVVTRVRPQANQANPAATTTTTTQYDSLGRMASIIYNDNGLTPNRYFYYDQTVNWGSVNLGSSKGQLTFASVAGLGIQFQYDLMNHVTFTVQCLPGLVCGQNDIWHSYVYDLVGDLTSETYYAGTVLGGSNSYSYSPAEELTSIGDSRTGSIVTNVQNGPNGPASFTYGNGLGSATTYDQLGRLWGRWVCAGSSQPYCTCGNQLYGFDAGMRGSRVVGGDDTILNSHMDFGYDEFNRLSSASYTGLPQLITFSYDRYGNRWNQTLASGVAAPQPSFAFNTNTNQIIGYTYDAAGNLINDGNYSYTYDAEGNVLQVNNGAVASYTYDALNHRVRAVVNGTSTEYAYNVSGQRVATFDSSGNTLTNQIYWGNAPVAYYGGGQIHFQHQDWLGTERMRTSSAGAIEAVYRSLPFGDEFTSSGADNDPYHFAQLDHDSETSTEHAQFRQYSSTQGRWMSPDPYDGSYDADPQSFNRYAYAMNMPLSDSDPSGQSSINAMLPGGMGSGCPGGFPDQNGNCYLLTGTGITGGSGGTYEINWGDDTSLSLLSIGWGVAKAPSAPSKNCTNGVGTGGVGVGAGYNADLGVGAAGASSTGGVGGGLFHNSGGGFSGGLFGSGGAAAYFGSHMAGAPSQTSSSFVLGGYAGAGASFFFTNAGGAQQLGGPFTTVSINVGVGVANLGVQLSFGGGIWQLGVTPPLASVGIGAAGSVIRTNTITTHAGCH